MSRRRIHSHLTPRRVIPPLFLIFLLSWIAVTRDWISSPNEWLPAPAGPWPPTAGASNPLSRLERCAIVWDTFAGGPCHPGSASPSVGLSLSPQPRNATHSALVIEEALERIESVGREDWRKLSKQQTISQPVWVTMLPDANDCAPIDAISQLSHTVHAVVEKGGSELWMYGRSPSVDVVREVALWEGVHLRSLPMDLTVASGPTTALWVLALEDALTRVPCAVYIDQPSSRTPFNPQMTYLAASILDKGNAVQFHHPGNPCSGQWDTEPLGPWAFGQCASNTALAEAIKADKSNACASIKALEGEWISQHILSKPHIVPTPVYKCTRGPTWPLPAWSPTLTSATLRNDWVFVTASNTGKFFDRLMNLVASVQYWEPELSIVVFDLGLTEQEVQQVQAWANVHLRLFSFSRYPPHVLDLSNYAWKPLLYAQVLEEFDRFVYMDAGWELRAPLDQVFRLVARDGYFYTAQEAPTPKLSCCGDLTSMTHGGLLRRMGLHRPSLHGALMVAGGLQAYEKHSVAHSDVLVPVVKCALDISCIAPSGSTVRQSLFGVVHRFDQSAFSAAVAARGLTMQTNTMFWANRFSHPKAFNGGVEESGGAVMFGRRGQSSPYSSMLKVK